MHWNKDLLPEQETQNRFYIYIQYILCIYIYIYIYVYIDIVCMCISLRFSLSICIPLYLFIFVKVYPQISALPPVYLYILLSICLSIFSSIYLSILQCNKFTFLLLYIQGLELLQCIFTDPADYATLYITLAKHRTI